jgi:hypothetical protein
MMKRIGGSTGASFHLGMSGLCAHIAIHVQLTCGSGMTLTEPGGVTSSVPIRTRTLWYGGNFFVLFKFYKVLYIRLPLRVIHLFQPCKFSEWIDMKKPPQWQMKIPIKESKIQCLQWKRCVEDGLGS